MNELFRLRIAAKRQMSATKAYGLAFAVEGDEIKWKWPMADCRRSRL